MNPKCCIKINMRSYIQKTKTESGFQPKKVYKKNAYIFNVLGQSFGRKFKIIPELLLSGRLLMRKDESTIKDFEVQFLHSGNGPLASLMIGCC